MLYYRYKKKTNSMQISFPQQTPVLMVSGQPPVADEEHLATYWRMVGLPVAVTVALIAWVLLRSSDLLGWHEWVPKITMLGVVNIVTFRRYRQLAPMLIASGLAGMTTGLLLAIVRLVADYSFYLVFNLIAEPAVTLGVALAVAFSVGLLCTRLPRSAAFFHRRVPKLVKG